MVDMRVKVGNLTFQNPIMPASGAFSTDLAQVMDLNRLGALVMKTTAPPILRRFGFRTVLMVNGVICAATSAARSMCRWWPPVSVTRRRRVSSVHRPSSVPSR